MATRLPKAGYRPSEDEPFMNARQREYFRRKLLAWRGELQRESSMTLQHLQEDNLPAPDIADRRLGGVRTRTGAPYARPRAQVDRQDRRRTPADRGRVLRVLRGDRRAHQPDAPRGAPHRDAERRGSGTARAPRTARIVRSKRGRPAASPAVGPRSCAGRPPGTPGWPVTRR